MGGWEVPLEFPDGNVRMTDRREGGTPVVEVFPSATSGPLQGARRYRTHFSSCPDAEDWRKR